MRNDPHNVYMEPRALAFLRAWPDVPVVLRPAWSRFRDAGLMDLDPDYDEDFSDGKYPSYLRLTPAGQALREIVTRQSYNLFSHEEASAIGGLIIPETEEGYLTYKNLWRDPVAVTMRVFGSPKPGDDIKSKLAQLEAVMGKLLEVLS